MCRFIGFLNTAVGMHLAKWHCVSKALVLVISKMIKEWCERQVPRKVLGDSHLKNSDNWLKKIERYANIHL